MIPILSFEYSVKHFIPIFSRWEVFVLNLGLNLCLFIRTIPPRVV